MVQYLLKILEMIVNCLLCPSGDLLLIGRVKCQVKVRAQQLIFS